MRPSPEENDLCVFNGINGATGKYLTPPMEPERLIETAFGATIDPKRPTDPEAMAHVISGGGASSNHLKELKRRHESTEPHFGVRPGIDSGKLEQAGWGILFPHDADPAIKDALKELLEWRKPQAGDYYYEFEGYKGYRLGDSHLDFLARQKMGPGQADPKKVPYYLLIVGDPESIPFAFQYQLDVQYAVGRLWFDTPEEYARYARSVVTAEKGQVALPRRAVLFGVRNPDDQSTRLSSAQLVEPLGKALPTLLPKGQAAWDVQTLLASDATKSRLARLLGGDETPALLFTASHGMGFPADDPRQLSDQGALLCQDWPGPRDWDQPIPPEHYFAADDVAEDASLIGLIAMHFACYGAGCPRFDDFGHMTSTEPPQIAPQSFLASLPRKLLSHPRGGALAVIGHVDRAWGYSFNWREAGPQLQSFEDTLKELMRGQPVGAALESLNQRYADLSSALSGTLQDVRYGKQPDVEGLAGMWTANNDARSYMILGDPAARLPLTTNTTPAAKRPVIETITFSPPPAGPGERGAPNSGPPGGSPAEAGSTPVTPLPARVGAEVAEVEPEGRCPQEGPALPSEPITATFTRPAGASGTVTVTIPLQITIRLGDPVAAAIPAMTAPAPPVVDVARGGHAEGAGAADVAFGPPPTSATNGPTDVVPGTGTGYYLIAFDDQGRERSDHPRGLVSRLVYEALAREPFTDVFLFSHGWQGDVPAARRQYQDWVGAMAERRSDRARIAQLRPNFRGLLVGVHWPSLPWGDEDLGGVSFGPTADAAASFVEAYARRLGDVPGIREHLRTIARSATAPGSPDRLPPDVSDAYREIDHLLGLGSQGVAGSPDADRESFDPDAVYYEALTLPELDEAVSYGSGCVSNLLLAPLRTLSFWTMKARARQFGEQAIHPLLVGWQRATSGREVRFHLMGHSFGCIVATATVVGPPGAPALPRPIDSLSLLQGALSLWSYCGDIPHARGRAGYFHRLVSEGRVRGPVITTQSRYDRAVGTWYPLAARAGSQVDFVAKMPKYGAVGAFGIQGQDLQPVNLPLGPETVTYPFESGRMYNLEASRYVCRGGGFSGAHSDICRPEVAHAVWSAAMGIKSM
jgi:hypothetical protein